MLFTPTGTFYSKVQFKTEEEVEKVVVKNFKLLFGDHSILLPKSLIRTSGVVGENAVMNRETKNKIAELCIAEIGKQKKFSRLLESDLKIQQISPSRTTMNGWVTPWSRRWWLRSLPVELETASPSGKIRIERN